MNLFINIMAYLAVNKDGDEIIFGDKPIREHNSIWDYSPEALDTNMCFLPKGSIKKLIGKELTWADEAVEFNRFTINASKDVSNTEKYELIDLGLPSGTLWMDRNVGASSPTDFGLYFAWGETTGYTVIEVGKTKQFSWADYKYANGTVNKLTKYCNKIRCGNYGYTDSLVTLQSVDDAAYQFTDGKCQMPTEAQIQELLDNTTYEWATLYGGVRGGLFTSKTNSNSIFVPANGYCDRGSVKDVCNDGYIWSNSLSKAYPSDVWFLSFDSDEVECYNDYRCFGYSVRGVANV